MNWLLSKHCRRENKGLGRIVNFKPTLQILSYPTFTPAEDSALASRVRYTDSLFVMHDSGTLGSDVALCVRARDDNKSLESTREPEESVSPHAIRYMLRA